MDGFQEILEAISRMEQRMGQRFDHLENRMGSMEQRLDSVEIELKEIRSDLRDFHTQVNTLEHRMITLDTTIRIVNRQFSDLKLDVDVLKESRQ